MVMIGFLMLSLTLYYVFLGLISLSKLYGVEIKRRRQLVIYMTTVSASLLALQSVGQLSQRDIMVLFPLAMLAYLYNAYAKNGRRQLSG